MRRGFTIVEAITVIVLLGIISGVFAVYIREGFDAWRFLSGQKNIALSTRASLNRMVRELKRVKENANLTTFTSKEVTFLDVDNDLITFSQNGTDLLRNTDILLDDLQDPCGLFITYLDKDGNETAQKTDIRTIHVRLTVIKGENKFVIESAARIRVRRT